LIINNKKINLFTTNFILFWMVILFGALFSILAFIYFSFIWFIFSLFFFIVFIIKLFLIGISISTYRTEQIYYKQRIEQLIHNINDAIIIYDKDFRIIAWNRASEDIFKLKKEDILGQIISPEKISNPSLKTLTQTIFVSLAPSVVLKTTTGEYPQLMDISFSDQALELSIITDRILDINNNPAGFLKIIKNRSREVALLRAKSDFITVAAHQLRTPLTAVHWIFETFIKSKTLSLSDKELIESGLESSSKLLKIVNDLLDVSKIESGNFGYYFAKINISEFMDELLKNANVLAKKYNIFLYFDRPKTPITIYGDSQKLGIVFSNLIDNAIKYNIKNGQVVIKIESYPNRPYIQISIKDTGVGMSKDILEKLFSKFFRGANVIKEQTNGSGLGLYIAKNIIVRHGGNISVSSTPGRGSVFYIVLPTDPTLIPPSEVNME